MKQEARLEVSHYREIGSETRSLLIITSNIRYNLFRGRYIYIYMFCLEGRCGWGLDQGGVSINSK